MRLNKDHKSRIINKIVNLTKSPLTKQAETLTARLQEWVYNNCDPCFKQYQELYKGSYHRDTLYYGANYNNSVFRLSVYIPNNGWLERKFDNKDFIYVTDPKWDSSNDPELDAIVKDFIEVCGREVEYRKDIENLKTIINNAKTDTELLAMLPELETHIKQVCIPVEKAKQLPATMGLPGNLTRWGLELNGTNTNSNNEVDNKGE
ncbi:TPA: hypothetical protein QB624_000366 [Pasteurella multocida]|nr:hypothetical protein [Pasteurella multocida]